MWLTEYLLAEGFLLARTLLMLLSGGIAYVVWDKLHDLSFSRRGIIVRLSACIALTLLGLLSISGFIGFLLLFESPFLSQLAKSLIEGPWLAFAFFRAIPRSARYISLVFLAPYIFFQLALMYLFLSAQGVDYANWEALICFLAILATIASYLWLVRNGASS